jgi:hypothetical protein
MANKGLLVPRDLKVQMELLVERDQEDSEAIKVIYNLSSQEQITLFNPFIAF